MTDLLSEMSRVRAEFPTAPDEVVAKLARFRIADAKGDDEVSGQLAIDLVAMELASSPWWRWLMRPKLWLLWLALRGARS
jgi:hypothetical protein